MVTTSGCIVSGATTVAVAWAQRDPAAMIRYFEQTSTLTADERARLLAHVRQATAAVR
jgi:hypothetical protein